METVALQLGGEEVEPVKGFRVKATGVGRVARQDAVGLADVAAKSCFTRGL
jgi:hypothetical protein